MKYKFYWPVIWEYRVLLLDGLVTTLLLFAAGTLLSVALGIVMGSVGSSRDRWLRRFGEIYVEVNRNTPLVVKLFLLYFGSGLDAYSSAILGLALHHSAYMAEVIRSGIQSIPSGQIEAGRATGLTRLQVIRHITLPQALVIVIPPLTTQILEVLKNSSIAMTITIPELTFQTQQIEANTFRGFEAATAATLAYLIIAALIAGAAIALERALMERRRRIPVATPPHLALPEV